MNHINYGQRLEFIRTTIKQRYCLDTTAIIPIEYDPQCPFPYNNFVYRIKLCRPTDNQQVLATSVPQPGAVSIPQNAQHVVMRLSNSRAGLNDQNRVQNEVAAMTLVREALEPRQIIPAIYGWASAAKDQGWILMEHMSGTPLDASFQTMCSDEEKMRVLREVASIVLSLQQFELPKTIQLFGGLSFDCEGKIVSAPLTVFHGGPFETYQEMITTILKEQLAAADRNPIIRGWQKNGIRPRLDRFISEKVGRIMQKANAENKRLIHGDFTMNNILFDKDSFRITALIDFDWAHIGLAADEFLKSFHESYARLPGPYEPDPDRAAFRHALLHGFPSPLPAASRTVQWDTAEMWDRQLAEVGANRPKTLEGIDALSFLHSLSDLLCPNMLCNEVIVKQRSIDSMEKEKEDIEQILEKYLQDSAI